MSGELGVTVRTVEPLVLLPPRTLARAQAEYEAAVTWLSDEGRAKLLAVEAEADRRALDLEHGVWSSV